MNNHIKFCIFSISILIHRFSCCYGEDGFSYKTPWFSNTCYYHSQIFCLNYNEHCIVPCPYSSNYAYGQPIWIDSSSYVAIGWHETSHHEPMVVFNTIPSTLFLFHYSSKQQQQFELSVLFFLSFFLINRFILNIFVFVTNNFLYLVHVKIFSLISLRCNYSHYLYLLFQVLFL